MKKAILYLNQFFGQIGGEDKADYAPEIREGLVGPAMALNKELGDDVEVTHTIICGDNFIGSNQEEAVETILGFLKGLEFDIFFAGPAFRAGRYGSACGHISKAVKENFNIPVITSMNDENPGVEMFRKEIHIFKGGKSAAAMRKDVKNMASFAKKVINKEELLHAEEEGYYGMGKRHQVWLNPGVNATDRVIDMLLKKVHGEEFISELPMPELEQVPIATAINDLSNIKIALATSGGIVPIDNPDRIQSASATRWGKYNVADHDYLPGSVFKTIHAGFDPSAADANPDVIVPLDALKAFVKEGRIGSVHDYFYSTVGTGTTQGEAARMGREIVEDLKEAGVDAVILTST